MKKIIALVASLSLMVLTGCVSMNIAGVGDIGGVNLGASADPINRTGSVNAGKSVKVGDTETSVNTSTSGDNLNVDTNTQYNKGE